MATAVGLQHPRNAVAIVAPHHDAQAVVHDLKLSGDLAGFRHAG
jgi:hypothetical protein